MTPKQTLSRRELLKAMTALGGAVAASSFLPDKWAKPEVGAGALPAHAQATPCEPTGLECRIVVSEVRFEGNYIVIPYLIQLTPPCPDVRVEAQLSASMIGAATVQHDISGPTDSLGRLSGSVQFDAQYGGAQFELVVSSPFVCEDVQAF